MTCKCNPFRSDQFDENSSQCGEHSTFVLKDKGRHNLKIENKSRHHLAKLRLVEGKTRTCDFLVLDCSSQKAFFVELKGQNLGDAVSQIQQTIQSHSVAISQFKFFCRIVQTKVIKSTMQVDKERLIKYMREKHKNNVQGLPSELVKIASRELIETI